MGSRRDNDGRLNMDAVRDEREGVSTQYTAEWLSNVQMPPKAHSVVQDINEPHSPRVSRSAPALSVKSRQSNAGISRSKLELQLRQLKERQQLDWEAWHLELEMQRQELELENGEIRKVEIRSAELRIVEIWNVKMQSNVKRSGEMRKVKIRSVEMRNGEMWKVEMRNV
jgi:Ser-tRNA(Ala) deacylase AlaX